MKIKNILIVIIVVLFGISFYIAKANTWGFKGFSWIGNNFQEGQERSDPVIGMITMEGSKYNVKIEGDGEQRLLVGSAWMGTGTQNDTLSLGWIHFNQPFDQARLDGLIANNCFGAGDCYGVRWNKKLGSNLDFEGYLSGWARMEIGSNGDNTPYPDIWVHFKSPANPGNYTCNENDHNYYVCVDGNGKLEGYAWSAEKDAINVEGNSGLGWIEFSKQFISLENGGVVAAHNQFCTTLPDENFYNAGCKNSKNFTGEFKFKAYQTGITLNSLNPGSNFRWTCEDGESPKTGEQTVCNYQNTGKYVPKLRVYDEVTKELIDCASQASVTVTSDFGCSVLVREAGGSNEENFEKDLSVGEGKVVEAKIDRQCLDGGEVKWFISGGSKEYDNGDTAGFRPNKGSGTKIYAQIVKDDKIINCSDAYVKVKEVVKLGQ